MSLLPRIRISWEGERLIKKILSSRRFYLVLRVIALLLIGYALLFLSRTYVQIRQGRAAYIPAVEALRPQLDLSAANEDVPLPESKSIPEPLHESTDPSTTNQSDSEQQRGLNDSADTLHVYADRAPEQSQVFDLSALQAINPDIVGWLMVEGTEIDYPILQDRLFRKEYIEQGGMVPAIGEHRLRLFFKYLYKDYLGRDSETGSITVDFRNTEDMTNPWIILYGHNVGQKGVMFSDLMYYCDEDFALKNSSAYLWNKNGLQELELIMVSVVSGHSSEVFDISAFLTEEEYAIEEGLKALREGELFSLARKEEPTDRFCLLSTCYVEGDPSDPARLVLLYRFRNDA